MLDLLLSLYLISPTFYPVEVKELQDFKVNRVVDGDTIKGILNGQQTYIRFCGIDAPELKQPLGEYSKIQLLKLIKSKDNVIKIEVLGKDQYNRYIVNGYINNQNIQYQLLYEGSVFYYKTKTNCNINLDGAEKNAQDLRLGVYNNIQVPPWEFRKLQKCK